MTSMYPGMQTCMYPPNAFYTLSASSEFSDSELANFETSLLLSKRLALWKAVFTVLVIRTNQCLSVHPNIKHITTTVTSYQMNNSIWKCTVILVFIINNSLVFQCLR